MTRRSTALLDWLLPIVFLAALSTPFWTTNLDLALSERFYRPGAGWPLGAEEPWHALKHYGVAPGFALGAAALSVLVASFWKRGLRVHRRAALYLVLVLALGPGVVVNDICKEHWGRPRPLDVVAFGGDRAYVKPWVKQPAEMGQSFASGHAAMAFYLLVPYFLLRRRGKGPAAAVLAIGLAYGTMMGCARIAQGAHFASDVLWALGLVYLTGLALFYLMGLSRPAAPRPPSPLA